MSQSLFSNDNALVNFYTNKNVLITGGTGFIGTYLVEKLTRLGAHVIILDDFSNSTPDHNKELFSQVTIINDSITNDGVLAQLFKNNSIDIVFHLAALRSVPESFQIPEKYYAVNTEGTLALLRACHKYNVKTFIFSSSAAVYGDYQDICHENLNCQPTSPYGLSKLNAETYCQLFAQDFAIDSVCLRYFNVYDDIRPTATLTPSVHSTFYNAFKNNLPITLLGDGNQTRDFIPLSRVVEANLLTGMHAHTIAGQVFNIATGKSISIANLLTTLQQQFPNYTNTINYAAKRTGDVDCSQASVQKYHDFLTNITQS